MQYEWAPQPCFVNDLSLAFVNELSNDVALTSEQGKVVLTTPIVYEC